MSTASNRSCSASSKATNPVRTSVCFQRGLLSTRPSIVSRVVGITQVVLARGFVHRYAGQHQFSHPLGVTDVAVLEQAIIRFINVAPAEINIDALPERRKRRLPSCRIPVRRLGGLLFDRI